jgi:glutathione S-transferase
MNRVRVVGSYLSPYVRKVLVFLDLKAIDYEIDPIVPFFGDDRFAKLSPIRRIPVLTDDLTTLCDSSVICQYLEDRYPKPALYPLDVVARARARWFEEFADSRMGDVFIWKLWNEVAINPYVWGKPTDEKVVEKALLEDIPSVLDYLETEVPLAGFICGDLSIADVALGAIFRNAVMSRYSLDAAKWPLTAAYVARVLTLEPFARLARFEDVSRRTPLAQQRAALKEAGAPITSETFGTATPKRGMMLA